MHNRKVFPAKDINYAASKGSATQNTALNPADLADGAIGVYGIQRSATNNNKLVLITDGGSESAGLCPAASFVGDQITVAYGVSKGPSQVSNPIDRLGGISRCTASKYTAPVKGVFRIGYNGVSGSSLNLPSTILRGDDFSISVVERNAPIAGYRDPYNKRSYSTAAMIPNESPLTVVQRWVEAVNKRPASEVFFDKTKVKILSNATGSAFANTATVTAVNGATSLTTSAAHGVGVGDYFLLDGDIYLAITGTASTTLVLNRPYQGANATITNANTVDVGPVAPTEIGLELVDKGDDQNLWYGVDGIASNATRKQQTASTRGSGTEAQVKAMEYEALPKKGSTDFIHSYMPHDVIRASGTYDLYIIEVRNKQHANGDPGSVFKIVNYLTLGFTPAADTTNFAQSDFEDIMQSLFGASVIPSISA